MPTISKWQVQGYPLDNPQELYEYVVNRDASLKPPLDKLRGMKHMTSLPPGLTKVKLKGGSAAQNKKPMGIPRRVTSESPELPTPAPTARVYGTKTRAKRVPGAAPGSKVVLPVAMTRGEDITKAPVPKPQPEQPASETEPSGRESVSDQALDGLRREMKRLQDECDRCYQTYVDTEDPVEKSVNYSLWQKMIETWGDLAKIAPKAEQEAGKLVAASEVEEVWSRACTEMRTHLSNMHRRLSTHPLFRTLNPVEVEEAVLNEVTAVLKVLQGEAEDENS
jgi:hypothetical protein